VWLFWGYVSALPACNASPQERCAAPQDACCPQALKNQQTQSIFGKGYLHLCREPWADPWTGAAVYWMLIVQSHRESCRCWNSRMVGLTWHAAQLICSFGKFPETCGARQSPEKSWDKKNPWLSEGLYSNTLGVPLLLELGLKMCSCYSAALL